MKKIFVAALLCSTSAMAADPTPQSGTTPVYVTKAPRLIGYPYQGCGYYYGLDAIGAGGAMNASTQPGATVISGEIGGLVGYSCAASASSFWFVEGYVNYTNLNGNASGLSLGGPISLMQRVGFGGPMSSVLGLIPGLSSLSLPTLPVLPAGVTVVTNHPYLFAALHEQDISANFGLNSNKAWEISPGVGIGVINQLSNNIALDVFAEAQLGARAYCVGSGLGTTACANLGTTYRAGIAFKY